jgi:hypothetical protein
LWAENLDLGEALETSQPPFGSAVTVPVRTPRGLQGCGVLYLVPDAAAPKAEVLSHLGLLSRALSSSLELARALETVRAAETALQLALAGTASIRGLDEIVQFLEELRDRLGTMRKRPEAPSFFLEEFARLAPSLAGALTTARSLVAFCKGEIHREVVSLADVLSELGVAGASLGPGADSVSGDPVLLRLALKALMDHASEELSGSDAVSVLGVSEAGLVRLTLGAPEMALKARPSATARATSEATLMLVRRIVELHGGSLNLEKSETAPTRYNLSLVPA